MKKRKKRRKINENRNLIGIETIVIDRLDFYLRVNVSSRTSAIRRHIDIQFKHVDDVETERFWKVKQCHLT